MSAHPAPAANPSPPRISVITPTFNSAATVEATIASVLDQGYPNLEYLIVDGGSTDGTLDILRQFTADQLTWHSEPDQGIADAFNKGIARATGDLIGIINSDDQYQPHTLATVAQAHQNRLAAHQPPAIIHGDMHWREADQVRLIKPRLWGGRDGIGLALYFDMPVNHPTCFVPASVYQDIGQFDIDFKLAMDVDLVIRAHRRGVRFEYVPKPLAVFVHGGVSTQSTRQAIREVYRAQRKNKLNRLPCMLSYAVKWAVNRAKAATGLRLSPGSRATESPNHAAGQ